MRPEKTSLLGAAVGVALSPVWSALTRHRGAPAAVAVGGEPSFTAEEVRAVARAVARGAVPHRDAAGSVDLTARGFSLCTGGGAESWPSCT